MSEPAYLIEGILPTLTVSLLGGLSDIGKTRWLLPMLKQWEQGHDVLGHKSYPCPWLYSAGDRSKQEVERTCRSLQIDPATIPLLPAYGKHNKSWDQVKGEIRARKASFAVVEGFGDYCPPPAQKHQVREFMGAASAFCEEYEVTILGVMESPKQKPFERYTDPRQRISGSASWGYHADTVLMIERQNPKDEVDPLRYLFACIKNSPRLQIPGTFDACGRLAFHELSDTYIKSLR